MRKSAFIAFLLFVAGLSTSGQTSTPKHIPCVANKARPGWRTYVNRTHRFCFQYPPFYKAGALPPDSEYRPYEHHLFLLRRVRSDATVRVTFNVQPFDLQNLVRIAAPTGMESPPAPLQAGPNTFYYYGPGGGGVAYPDQYFFNLNGKTLEILFDGPYGPPLDKSPVPATKQIARKILATLRTF